MFENLIDVFREVYNLAAIRRKDCDKNGPKSLSISDDTEKRFEEYLHPNKNTPRFKLEAYLSSLDFETIKVIQTIMYLGRDKDYKNIVNPEERYKRERESLDQGKGWASKEIEIDQIVGKVPLDKYLSDGFKILEIKI